MIELDLPWPPSVNESTRRYHLAGFRKEVTTIVMAAGWPTMGKARLFVVLTWHAPDNRRRDVDNPIKATLDSLKNASVYRDDSQIDQLIVLRGPIEKGGRAHVRISEIGLEMQGVVDYDKIPF